MATTTNYGWTTPDDTALVKDGAAAIRSLGSAIDSTLKTQIDAQIPDTIFDAKGDLISASAADTPTRLASSGVNGDVLQVDTSTATGLKWATPASGSITSLASGSLSSTELNLTSISGSYKDLRLILKSVQVSASSNDPYMRLNGVTTALSYFRAGGTTTLGSNNDAFFSLTGQSMPTTANNHTWVIYFPDYTNSSFKTIQFWMTANNFIGWGYQNTITSAITAIRFYTGSGASFSAGTYELQGIK